MSQTTIGTIDMSDVGEQHRIDMRTREGRMMREQATAASAPMPENAPHEIETPSGKRITRENRRGFGNQGQKLAAPKREGYFRYWFNDTPGRVMSAQESGYTPVLDPASGKPINAVVGVKPDGSPLLAYLQEIPQEWRDDDAAALEEKNSALEETIRRGAQAKDGEPDKKDHFYPSAQGRRLEIKHSLARRQ